MAVITDVPQFNALIDPAFQAIVQLGGSGTNDEIYDRVIDLLSIADDIANIPHLGRVNQSELSYRLAWAKTYLKKYGALENSKRGVWSVSPEYASVDKIDEQAVIDFVRKQSRQQNQTVDQSKSPDSSQYESPSLDPSYRQQKWDDRLADILSTMDPYGFERLVQRVFRESGFVNVKVTKKSGDGGIDGVGIVKSNSFLSFRVAFQCKRWNTQVGASDIRDFRGSLASEVDQGVFITTSTFTKQAKEKASSPGKVPIELIDGEELIQKLAELELGLTPKPDYDIDEDFFFSI
jgi:restriction system protein